MATEVYKSAIDKLKPQLYEEQELKKIYRNKIITNLPEHLASITIRCLEMPVNTSAIEVAFSTATEQQESLATPRIGPADTNKKQVLVVDHESVMVGELIEAINGRGFQAVTRMFSHLHDVAATDFFAVVFGSGYSKIRNNPLTSEEFRIWRECEDLDIPLMAINHGAQVGAVYSGGSICDPSLWNVVKI